jgi:TIR domain
MSEPNANRPRVDQAQAGDSSPEPDRDEAWDFFISRAGPDAAFSSEIARILKAQGWRVFVQELDFANRSFMERMHAGLKSTARVIALLSPDYLSRDHCEAEWQAALADDPLNRNRRLIVMRVRESKPEGLLATFAYWDLVPLRDNPTLFEEVVLAAARNETLSVAAPYWQTPDPILHTDLRPLPAFTGRRDDLARIHGMLHSEPETDAVKIVAIKGAPGVGKSMLVRKYAWDNQDHYAGVWLMPAESETLILEGLVALGARFLRGLDQVKDRYQAARQALALIEAGGFEKPWLLIYDNVDKPDTITRLTPRRTAHALITTRWSDWYGQAAELPIEVFSKPVSIEFLLNRTRFDDRDGASQLAAALGYLPLALEHAGSYCKATGTTFDSYRASLADLNQEEAARRCLSRQRLWYF